jgi:VWFA-related protein
MRCAAPELGAPRILLLAGGIGVAGHQQVAPAPQPPKPAAPAPPSQVFRGGVELVSLNVTVMDGAKYVTDLTQDDFEIFEDGAQQAITFFARGQQPIALAVLLDTSASMDERLPTAQEAAIGFAKRLRPDDAMEVIDFDSQVHILQTFTPDQAGLYTVRVDATTPSGATAGDTTFLRVGDMNSEFYDAEMRAPGQRHPVDGDDTSSLVAMTKCSTWRSGPRPRSTRSGCGPRASAAATSRKRNSYCGSSPRRPAAVCSSRPT